VVATLACPGLSRTRATEAPPCSRAWVAWAWRSQGGDTPAGSPARALALLSGSSVEALRAAIAGEVLAALARTPGVGRRLAAQLVLDLKAEVGPVAADTGPGAPGRGC
jgi:hypothetical protein